jgi:hypothetical protein
MGITYLERGMERMNTREEPTSVAALPSVPNSGRGQPRVFTLRILAFPLAAISAIYLGVGFYRLTVLPDVPRLNVPFAIDLSTRWREQLWMFGRLGQFREQEMRFGIDPDRRGQPSRNDSFPWGYPAWSYGMGLLVAPPVSWPVVRWYFALLNVAALAIIARWAFRQAVGPVQHSGFVLAALALSPISYVYCLSNGQFTILTTALVILMAAAVQQRWPVVAGLCAAGAMYKPHLGVLFMLILLLGREYMATGVAAAAGLITSSIPWALTGHNPVAFLRNMWSYSTTFDTQGLSGLLMAVGLSDAVSVEVLLAAGVAAALLLLWRFRCSDVRIQLAIAAAISMLWSYHKAYDYTVVVLLMVPLARQAMQAGSWMTSGALLFLCATNIVPLRMALHGLPAVQAGYALSVVVGLAALLVEEVRLTRGKPYPAPEKRVWVEG